MRKRIWPTVLSISIITPRIVAAEYAKVISSRLHANSRAVYSPLSLCLFLSCTITCRRRTWRSEALKFHGNGSSRIHPSAPFFKFFAPAPPNDVRHESTSQCRFKFAPRMFTCARIFIYSPTREICKNATRLGQPNWGFYKKKIAAYRWCAREKKARPLSPALKFLWIFPWECSALARCSLGLRQWTARRRGKSYGATRRRIHPFATPYAADSPLCGTDTYPHRRLFHSFSTRESLCLLSRLRKTRTPTRAMPTVDVHTVFTIVRAMDIPRIIRCRVNFSAECRENCTIGRLNL